MGWNWGWGVVFGDRRGSRIRTTRQRFSQDIPLSTVQAPSLTSFASSWPALGDAKPLVWVPSSTVILDEYRAIPAKESCWRGNLEWRMVLRGMYSVRRRKIVVDDIQLKRWEMSGGGPKQGRKRIDSGRLGKQCKDPGACAVKHHLLVYPTQRRPQRCNCSHN